MTFWRRAVIDITNDQLSSRGGDRGRLRRRPGAPPSRPSPATCRRPGPGSQSADAARSLFRPRASKAATSTRRRISSMLARPGSRRRWRAWPRASALAAGAARLLDDLGVLRVVKDAVVALAHRSAAAGLSARVACFAGLRRHAYLLPTYCLLQLGGGGGLSRHYQDGMRRLGAETCDYRFIV